MVTSRELLAFLIQALSLLKSSDLLECIIMLMSRSDIVVYCLAKQIESVNSFSVIDGSKFSMSKTAKVCWFLFNIREPVDH